MSLPIEVNPNMLGGGGYQISRSVRLRKSATAYFNRTPGSAGNQRTWTWSGWVKRGALGSVQILFSAYQFNTTDHYFGFFSSDVFRVVVSNWTTTYVLDTTAVFRDPSAWYHVVVSYDTTQATASDRVRLWINNVSQTFTGTQPTQNFDTNGINTTRLHNLGASNGGNTTDGYLTEINFIDGQALTPSSFGETNPVTGVWQPKKYSGTYGTNGFYLNFSDNSGATATTIGKDYSGNGNNWTPNNISVTAGSTYDSMLDTPTPYADGGNGRGNYATLNPLTAAYAPTISNANLTVSGGTGATRNVNGSLFVSSGKWYFEATPSAGGQEAYIGVTQANSAAVNATYYGDGRKLVNGVFSAYGASYTTNDVIGVALDLDAGTVVFYKNNVSQGTAAGSLTGSWGGLFITNGAFVTTTIDVNFGQRPFTYTPPSGFKALNTQNLPAPTIAAGGRHMAATTYTGTGSSLSVANTTSGLSFQPDFVWIKSRSAATDHALYDVLRGTQARVESNNADAEVTADNGVTAFGSNGFTVNTLAQVNTNAATYVGWQWKANGAGVTNTAGSITSTVSANTTAGFSVVTWTANNTAGATVGHGLGVTPNLIITKARSFTSDWQTYHVSLGATQAVWLNLTNSAGTSSAYWNNTAPTSSLITLGTNANFSTNTYVAYCFAPIAGFSAFGSYTGNGSTDGPFVYTGFRPRWVLIKRTDTAGLSWQVFDTSRDDINVAGKPLSPNAPDVEANAPPLIDILSNGFKLRIGANTAFNANGGTYIYAAFAEVPFKAALAR